MCLSLPWSCETSEYAGETGAYGTPASIAPRASSRCSMSLSERIATGRSTETGCASSHWAIERAARERLGVADPAPVAAFHPLGDEDAIGRRPRPSAGSGRSGAPRRAAAPPSRRPGSSRRRAGSASPRASRRAAARGSVHRGARRPAACAHDFCTFAALPARKSRIARLGRGIALRRSPPSATRRTGPRLAPCRRCAASACMIAKLDSGALAAMRSASSKRLGQAVPLRRRGTATGRSRWPSSAS